MSLINEEKTVQELAEAVGGEVTPRTIRYYIAEGLLPRPDERGRFTRRHEDRLRLILRYKAAFLPLEKIREQITALSDDEVRLLLEQAAAQEEELEAVSDDAAMLLPPPPPPPAQAPAAAPAQQRRDRADEARSWAEAEASPAPPARLSSAAEYTARLLAAQKRQGFAQAPEKRARQQLPQEPSRARTEQVSRDEAAVSEEPAFAERAQSTPAPTAIAAAVRGERETQAGTAHLWERIAIIPGVVEVHVRAGIAPELRARVDRALRTLRELLS